MSKKITLKTKQLSKGIKTNYNHFNKLSKQMEIQLDSGQMETITILQSPLKPNSDKKKYKVIRLANGLTALLISDVCPEPSAKKQKKEEEPPLQTVTMDVDDNSDDYTDLSDDESSSCEDDNDDEKMAACALCVGVGSFSDPPEIQGLAHFVEHMVFLGSKKYPKENDFDSFIKKNGGSDNASTDCEQTTFHFQIQDSHFAEAMDKFSNFFVAPLMNQEAMQRERESIESEFALALPSDSNRIDQLISSFLPTGHPIGNFTWGNSKSLSEPFGPSDPVLHAAAHKFRERHYSAHRMTVAVQARMPLSTLEKFVVSTFGCIPSNFLPPNDFSSNKVEQNIITPDFNAFYLVKPANQVSEVILTWCMKSFLNEYKSKPHQYISWILGHEGTGSLLCYLRKKVWALGLYTGNSESGIEHTSLACFFTIKVILTPEGLIHIEEVLDSIFSYLNLLRRELPNERIFKEMQGIEEIGFRFTEEPEVTDNVEDLCEAMHFYPPEHYITGADLFYEYKPDLIKFVIGSMTPESVNIMVLSDSMNKDIDYNCIEQWFGTPYTKSDISEEKILRWKNIEPLSDFFLPLPNIYMDENYDLIPISENPEVYPTLLKNDDLMEVWFKPDYKFKLPHAIVGIHFETPLILSSAKDCVLLTMWCAFLRQLLIEKCYDAEMAGYSHSISLAEKGIAIQITGYSSKMPNLLDDIIKIVRNYDSRMNEHLFKAIKDVQAKSYHNMILKPNKIARELRLSLMYKDNITSLQKLEAISTITYDEFCKIGERFREQLHLQVLIQGNLDKNTVATMVKSIQTNLDWKKLNEEDRPKNLCYELKGGESYCRVQSFNENNVNSTITSYYQGEQYTMKDYCMIKLIMLLMEEPMFDTLRTKEQLGYSVFCSLRHTGSVLGFSVTVNGQADKHSADHIDARIENFLETFYKEIQELNIKSFNHSKKALSKLMKCVDVDLKEEFTRNWDEILSNEYCFDHLVLQQRILKTITKDEVLNWLKDHFRSGKSQTYRKLAVQVVGNVPPIKKRDVDDYKYNFMSSDNGQEFVNDISSFKTGLKLLPEMRKKLDLINDQF